MAPKRAMSSTASPAKKAKVEPAPIPAASSFFAPRKSPVKSIVVKKEEKAVEEVKGKGKAKLFEDSDSDLNASLGEEEESGSGSDQTADEDDEAMLTKEKGKKSNGKLAAVFTQTLSQSASVDWVSGQSVPYAAVTECFTRCDGTTKRLEISAHLSNLLIRVIEKTPKDLIKVVYLCINRLCPEYEPLELGLGEFLIIKAIAQCTGRKIDTIKADYQEVGDLGQVAQNSRNKQATLFKPKALTVPVVFDTLKQIAKISGNASGAKKIGLIAKLFSACVGSETKFLIRSLEGKLRIGLAERTVLVSLAHAIVTTEAKKSDQKVTKAALEAGAEVVKAVYSELPSYDLVIPGLLDVGIKGIQKICYLTPGVPLKPMLAKPTKAISEVLDRFEDRNFTCEYKYDGERAQVHYLEDGSIRVFSRNSEDMSEKYPDIVDQLPACILEGTTSFVIDCEAVAWDMDTGKLLPFQELSKRKRKDVKKEDIKVKVHLFAFDLLYLNGTSLLEINLLKRRELLRKHLTPVENQFSFATSEDATNVEDIQVFLDKSVTEGCEGLMVKMLEGEGSSYEPSRRSIHWLKLKKDYLAGVGDSFDLVVIGGDYGKGKRTNFYGAFHLAIYDAETGTYQSICKIGTGFTDEVLESHYKFFHEYELEVKKPYYDMGTGKGPDVYFEPKMVWEVLAADLSLSPIYTAAKGLCGERGISLRFPRYLRTRDDKGPEDSTEPERVAEAYRDQAVVVQNAKKGGGGDGDSFW